MQSAPAGLWDPHGPQSEDVSPLPLPLYPPSACRLSHLIAAPPAKRITFYKRGDDQFAGVRMAVHKRSFKCFDALLDDLSQKVPLTFGVRTVTTPRGIHSIKHLEQLEDGGCYLCSDRRQAKPINMELAGKRPALWHHNSHTPTRQRRILLVRNSDPAVRRSVILSRRSTRSLRVFLEDISELMRCHVRKLYTLEGRKKSYANGLGTCPHSHSGREAVLNDDIEKRVLVNKDGSLSVEMRVRFHLQNDEKVQWSTEIKKSPSDSLTNDCCPLSEAQPCYLQQGQSESCSDPDSTSCVAEAADYAPKPPQRSLKEPQPRCACCYQRQDPEYDLWENSRPHPDL
ncbi:unnamed protein product [Coregonus sp. 'balchen']|nr:unnamed protein product [Coregonus sp. 'balchen']